MIQALEVAAAIIVTAGLVAGNLFLFSPLRSDDRGNALSSDSRSAATGVDVAPVGHKQTNKP